MARMRIQGFVLLVACSTLAGAQTGPPDRSWAATMTNQDLANRYEARFGRPEFWSLSLLVGPERAHDVPSKRSIATLGRLDVMPRPGAEPQVWLCTEGPRDCLALDRPAEEISQAFFDGAELRRDDVAEVVGAFVEEGFLFWSFSSGPAGREDEQARGVTLEDLIMSPSRYAGRLVTVRGRFRGRNLFDDMPEGSERHPEDWVLRDGPFFIWVTGLPPKGQGFALDLEDRTDGAYRLEVEGEPEVRDGLIYLRAGVVRLLGRVLDEPGQ